MNCQEVREYFSRFLEGEISSEERALVGAHLSTCKSCRMELEALKKTIHAVQSVPSDKPPPGFANQVMARIRYEGSRSSLFERLFTPLSMKVPAYAVTLLLIAGIYYYMNPELESKKEAERLADVGVAGNKESFSADQSDQESKPVLQESPAPAPPPPHLRKKKVAAKPAPEKKNDTARSAGVLKQEAPAPSSPEPAPVAKEAEAPQVKEFLYFAVDPFFLERLREKEKALFPQDETSTLSFLSVTGEGLVERNVSLRRYWKNYVGGEGVDSKTLLIVQSPPDVRGTGWLIWTYSIETKKTDRWMYNTSLRKVIKLVNSERYQPLLGTEFSLSDLEGLELRPLELDEIRLTGEAPCGTSGESCYMVERIPKQSGERILKRIEWRDKKDFLPRKIEFYERTIYPSETQTIEWTTINEIKVMIRSETKNFLTGHRSAVQVSAAKINTDLPDDFFTEENLKKQQK